MRTVLVTGGAGYIGSHCCARFAAAGWKVVAFDNLSQGHRHFVRWGPLIEGDVLDRGQIGAAVQAVRPDLVAHLAARSDVAESVASPAGYFRANAVGTLNLLDAMRLAGVNQMIFSSTAAVYGAGSGGVFSETSPVGPVNPYGHSKIMAETSIAGYAAAYGLRAVIFRFFNAAGADPDAGIGERHDPETHLIPLAIRAAIDPRQTLTVRGTDFPTPDGSAVRDYVHVADLACAHVLAADYLAAGGEGTTLNLGAGAGASVLEVVQALERVSGRRTPYRMGPRRPGDPPVLVALAGEARRVLGWTPARSDLDNILRTAWGWHISAGFAADAAWITGVRR